MIRLLLALFLIVPLAGCASMVSSATGRMATDLSDAILEQNDPENRGSRRAGLSVAHRRTHSRQPEERGTVALGAKLYGAYASVS